MSKYLKHIIFILLFLATTEKVLSQCFDNSFYLWKLHTITGEVQFNGFYREQERLGLNINEFQKSSFLSGGLILKTNSSILSKNFLTLDIDAGYMPETSRDNFLVIPDQAEVRTTKKIGGGATFLKNKMINFSLFGNYNESYSSRENLTDVKSLNKHWGAAINFNNKFLPFTLDLNKRTWDEEEILTHRRNSFDQSVYSVHINKSFTKFDHNEFRFSHDENVNINQYLFRIANKSDNLDFLSHINFDKKNKYSLNSIITNYNQQGNSSLRRFQINESVSLMLPANLILFATYNYFDTHFNEVSFHQQNVSSGLEHKLFKSLTSRINFEQNILNHTAYSELNTKIGAEFNYSKTIPGGQLLLSYRYDRYKQDHNSNPTDLNITDEQYNLSDNKIVLLKLPDINIASIVVSDATGTIIYLLGLDYILIQRGKYIEIRRIPGGAIADNSSILIDYLAKQPGKYSYNANTHVVNTSLYLFRNILSFSYRFSTQDYSNLQTTEFITLNYFTQNIIGCRFDVGFINAGAEYEHYRSSILPYNTMRYYLNLQKDFAKKFLFSLGGNYQDYNMLDQPEPINQKYLDVTARLTYSIIRYTKLNVDMMYRNQSGRGINLDLFTSKAEIATNIHRFSFSIGVELYRRNYVGEQINFKGTYFKLSRKF